MFDLLKTISSGGCSAKLSPELLDSVLKKLDLKNRTPNLLVGSDTHDDAAVYKINDEQAIVFTTDFFPPVCSDPYTFGQIAATNALSDVYAMGGQVLVALNIIMFPSCDIPLEVLGEILRGGQDKVSEAGGLIVGGHTIDDTTVKYGLAVVGLIHPERIITNAAAKEDDVLLLTKPLGTATLMVGHRQNLTTPENFEKSLKYMKQLNKAASELMIKYGIKAATDITGFGLLGHAVKMAKASRVCLNIDIDSVPFMDGALELVEAGCIPGASFRNQTFVEGIDGKNSPPPSPHEVVYSKKMLLYDAQTSGGMLICVPQENALDLLSELKRTHPETAIIGQVEPYIDRYIRV